MKQAGFGLIEIIVASLVSAMLALILYQTFSQTQFIVKNIRIRIEDNSEVLSWYHQLSRDIESMTVGNAQSPFVCSVKGGTVDYFSFISTNALTNDHDDMPLIKRIRYTFVPQESHHQQPLYMLTRQELPYQDETQADRTTAHKSRSYSLIRNIVHCSMQLITYTDAKEQQEIASLKFKEWDKEFSKKSAFMLPHFVHINMTILNPITDTTHEHTFMIPVIAAPACVKVKNEKEKAEKESNPPQPPTPPMTEQQEQGPQPMHQEITLAAEEPRPKEENDALVIFSTPEVTAYEIT